jgi:hypothetical protein
MKGFQYQYFLLSSASFGRTQHPPSAFGDEILWAYVFFLEIWGFRADPKFFYE